MSKQQFYNAHIRDSWMVRVVLTMSILMPSFSFNRLFAQDNALYIDEAGRVGIGTSTPESTNNWETVLDVHGSTNSKAVVSTTTISTGLWSNDHSVFNAPAGGIVGTRTNHPFSLVSNSECKLTILPNGNVGIGTSNPTQKLVTNGVVLSAGENAGFSFQDKTQGSWTWYGYQEMARLSNTKGSTVQDVIQIDASGNTMGVKSIAPPSGQALSLQGSVQVNGPLDVTGAMGRQQLAGSGYQVLGNLLIQWGHYQSTDDGEQPFDFPIAFGQCFSVTANWDYASGSKTNQYPVSPMNVNASGFSVDRADGIKDSYFYFIAIGSVSQTE